jgi:hypothetical protein
MKRSLTALTLFVVAVSCGGGSSSTNGIPQADACNQGAKAACAKLFACNDGILVLAQAALGGSAGACETMIKANYCSTFECTAGQTYHGDKAQQCKDDFASVSCATLAAAASSLNIATVLASVPSCQQTCTGGDAGSGG